MWLQLKGHAASGTMVIATPHGPETRAVQDGIVDWPDTVPPPAGSRPTAPPEEVRAQELARRRAEARALAESLGLRIADDGEMEPKDAPEIAGTVIVGTPPPLERKAKKKAR